MFWGDENKFSDLAVSPVPHCQQPNLHELCTYHGTIMIRKYEYYLLQNLSSEYM